MFGERAGTALTAIKNFFGPDMTGDRLNPVHVAVAARGYQIQSQLLHIPDDFGFFVPPGSPRVQARVGAAFCYMLVANSFRAGWYMLHIVCIGSNLPLVTYWLATWGRWAVIYAVYSYCLLLTQREPDYDWGVDDGKAQLYTWRSVLGAMQIYMLGVGFERARGMKWT